MSRTRQGRRFFGSVRADLFVPYEFVMRLPRSGEQLRRGLIEATSSRRRPSERGRGIPRLYAAASLKPKRKQFDVHVGFPYSAALCRGLIEAPARRCAGIQSRRTYSAALCRGLIEARPIGMRWDSVRMRIPRLYAAASLKQERCRERCERVYRGIPRLYAAASLKLNWPTPSLRLSSRIPRLYAAASLKPAKLAPVHTALRAYSAALCRGLIEA